MNSGIWSALSEFLICEGGTLRQIFYGFLPWRRASYLTTHAWRGNPVYPKKSWFSNLFFLGLLQILFWSEVLLKGLLFEIPWLSRAHQDFH